MFQSHFVRRTVQLAACGMATLLCTPGASGEPTSASAAKDKRACKISYKSAKERESTLRLREASDLYLACAKAPCSAFYKQVCTTRFAQLQADIPSIIPVVVDEKGVSRDDVLVKMDTELLATRLDGRALPVEPGAHNFSFEVGGVTVSQKVLMMEGQRNRPIAVSFGKRAKSTPATLVTPTELEPTTSSEGPARNASRKLVPEKEAPVEEEAGPASEPASEPERRGGGPGALPYIIGVAGLAGIGTGALFTLWGRKDNDALGACSPSCRPESVDHVRKFYTIADISIGVGAAALGLSAILFATSGGSSKEAPPAKAAAYTLDVQTNRNGAFATVSGAF